MIPCHAAKHGAPEHRAWENKLFAKKRCGAAAGPAPPLPARPPLLASLDHNTLPSPRSFPCPITGAEKELYVFTKAVEGARLNVLELSKSLPDIRGGLGLAGAEPAVMEATRSVKVSERRVAGWAQ